MKKTSITLSDEQYSMLQVLSQSYKKPVSELIREVIPYIQNLEPGIKLYSAQTSGTIDLVSKGFARVSLLNPANTYGILVPSIESISRYGVVAMSKLVESEEVVTVGLLSTSYKSVKIKPSTALGLLIPLDRPAA